MDRSWMYHAPRYSQTFVNGVQNFLNFAFERSSVDEKITCPCIKCLNMKYQSRQSVLDHLICSGFQPEYLKWVYHGEGTTTVSTSTTLNEEMHDLINDAFEPEGESGVEAHDNASNNSQETNNRGSKFDYLVKEAEEKVYPNCKYNKLSCVVHLYHLKCLNGWSDKSFTMLLEYLKDLLPEGNLLPKTTQQVKRILANLGLGYEKIHSCPNGCMLFWDGKEKDEVCSFCGSSRWKVHEGNPDHEVSPPKKKASKILRWFPLKPRLQRLFMSSKTSDLMKWHHTERVKDGKLRHPADALAWKDFDKKFPEFASDPRNVRLALASDGFNPFRTMNVAHSIWPVFLIPYNLPPWLVMKQPNIILSLIIPGPKGPGNKIDVYMQPLIKELKELWEDGVNTFDASTKQYFQLKASIISTISDFPGYANLSGWSTKGELACPVCGFDTNSKWLTHGRKWCYMCHRRWLPTDHSWRSDKRSFVGQEPYGMELRNAPIPASGDEVLQQLDGIEFLRDNDVRGPWKKKSIFLFGTLLGQEGKSKDNYKTRLDLKEMGIRKDLHPKKRPRSNITFMPKACYQMARGEKNEFLKTLKLIKPPDEFSSNISRCVQLNERKLVGMKSYDCHMLMQEYLPIALRGTLSDHVSSVIIELCSFFKSICYKDLSEVDLNFLESKVALTLCKLEKIFPPSFFTVMVHLVIHLTREVKLGGPVAFRWMYPIERDLLTLKLYVHNRAHPEGSIAEGYLAQESITFCSRYLSKVETAFTRVARNDDEGYQNHIETFNNLCPGRAIGCKLHSGVSIHKRKRSSDSEIDEKSLTQAHRYVLFNVESITPFREEHKRIVRQQRGRRISDYELNKIHAQQFADWFKRRVARMEEQGDEVTEDLKWLARGPFRSVKRCTGYLVNGYRFHTKNRERSLKTQNSGVVVTIEGESYASSRDRSPVHGMINYYGKLNDIIELNYSGQIRVVLFKCDWVDINRGCKIDYGVTLVNFSYKAHTGANLADDPYVLASQVDKVFYVTDPKNKDWEVVRHVKVRDVFHMGGVDDEVGPYSNDSTFNVPNLHMTGDDGEDGIDVTPEMEHEVDFEENEDDSILF
ncbi:hypothetical protein SSX86_007622 [Deinandra increscens subsp. villosa]|uniref:Transposase n=1 Tax=Deinandra increscens subsp. villosa TaxID=3103831 RepID=A0AAP0DLM9_9ASTR